MLTLSKLLLVGDIDFNHLKDLEVYGILSGTVRHGKVNPDTIG